MRKVHTSHTFQAANFLVKAIENPWGRKLYAKTLLKNIGQAVYKVSVGKCDKYVGGGRLVSNLCDAHEHRAGLHRGGVVFRKERRQGVRYALPMYWAGWRRQVLMSLLCVQITGIRAFPPSDLIHPSATHRIGSRLSGT